MNAERTQRLIQQYFDGELSFNERAELEQALQTQPAAARLFAAAARLDHALAESLSRQQAIDQSSVVLSLVNRRERAATSVRPRVRRWQVAIVAALLLGVPLAGALTYRSISPKRHQVVSGDVAVAGRKTQRIVPGAEISVVSTQPAVLQLADGSRAELSPRTRAKLYGADTEHRGSVEMLAGSGTFDVVPDGRVFTVDTPHGRVTALDTEFTVSLSPLSVTGVDPMHVRHVGLLVVVLSGLVQVETGDQTVLLATGESRAFGEERKARTEVYVRGRLGQSDSSILKLIEGGDQKNERTYSLTNATKTTIDHKPATVQDLKPGMFIKARLSDDGLAILAIEATGRTTFGVIDSVDVEQGTITLVGRGGEERGRTSQKLQVAADAAISVDDATVKLADIKVQTNASLLFGVDEKTVISITQRIQPKREQGRRVDYQTAKGAIAAVDTAQQTITLVRQSEGRSQTTILSVDKSATISVDGEPQRLEDLKVGQAAVAKHRGEPASAFEIVVGRKKGAEELRKEREAAAKRSSEP